MIRDIRQFGSEDLEPWPTEVSELEIEAPNSKSTEEVNPNDTTLPVSHVQQIHICCTVQQSTTDPQPIEC